MPTFFIYHQTGVLTRDAGFLFLKIKKATEYHAVHFVFRTSVEFKVNAEFFENLGRIQRRVDVSRQHFIQNPR